MSTEPHPIIRPDQFSGEKGIDFLAWAKALHVAVTKRWGKEVYWIRYWPDLGGPFYTTVNMRSLTGILLVYPHPGSCEGHTVRVSWAEGDTREQNILTIKTENGLTHAQEIATWIQDAVFRFQPRSSK